MEGIVFILALCAIAAMICGPVALIISITALNNSKKIAQHLQEPQRQKLKVQPFDETPEPVLNIREKLQVEQKKPLAEPYIPSEETLKEKPVLEPSIKTRIELDKFRLKNIYNKQTKQVQNGLEQTIGTRWVLIAGIIAVIFAVGFFLKYAYDNNLVGPAGRVIIVVIAGFISLAIGEITRRRGYDVVAKSVTALGFAILYSAVFAAYSYYELISSTYAYTFSIFITTAAMLYAVSLDEIAAAFLSLLGGFLTPLIISTGKNLPTPLFIYVLILNSGALICAYYRKWRAVEFVSFIGTIVLYTAWFEKFYRPQMRTVQGIPEQMSIALVWLVIFFIIFLILPVLYELLRKIEAKKEDAFLIVADAAFIFYYLSTILFKDHRTVLSLATLFLCVIYLGMMVLVIKKCRFDINLRLVYLAIGLFFLTITIPLYLKMYAMAIAWAIDGVVLTIIGLKYRSTLTRLGGAVNILLSLSQLFHHLPMHSDKFTLLFNPVFGTWCAVVAAIIVCHILYRLAKNLAKEQRDIISQASYLAASVLLLAAIVMEWYHHCGLNTLSSNFDKGLFFKGLVIVIALFPLLLLIRPVCPRGIYSKSLAMIIATTGSIVAIASFMMFYKNNFIIFANVEFLIVLFFVAMLFTNAWLLSKNSKEEQYNQELIMAFALSGILVLWILITEEIYLYWYCKDRFAENIENWRFLAHMYISVMWALYGAALMVAGFMWKKVILRYISLGLFGLLLLKVFILDTSRVESVYRIAAFLATGVTLVAVSYLYQFLKKKGYFSSVLSDEN